VEGTLQGKLRDRTMRIDFDGSNVAKVTGWCGSEYEVEMVCSGEDGEGEYESARAAEVLRFARPAGPSPGRIGGRKRSWPSSPCSALA